MPSYHELFITTRKIERTALFNLPFRVHVRCSRVSGWEVWALKENSLPEELLGGEFGAEDWLVLDVAGHVICDSRADAGEAVA